MPTYCAHCGAEHVSEGGFCAHCGQPIQPGVAAPPTHQPPPPTYDPQMYPQPSPALPRYPPQPVPPKVNPFLGWPVGDYVRDAAALFCLFATLGMPWHIEIDDKASEQWWVVIAVLLSVLSLAVPYVAKARVVPMWGPAHFRLLKLGLNVPFLASVLAAIINELIKVGEPFEGGLGIGIAMGLAGCALAVQPRQADEDPAHLDDRFWSRLGTITAIAAPVVAVLSFVGYLIDDIADQGVLFDEPLGFVALLLLTVVMMLAVMGWPVIGYVGGSPAWRRVFATVAFTVVVIGLFALASDGDGLFFWPPFEKWNGAAGFGGTFVLGAAAGLSVTRAQERRASGTVPPLDGWLRTARAAMKVSAAGSGVAAIALVIGIVNNDEVEASAIVATVMVVLVGAAAGVALVMLSDPGKNRVLVLGLLGAEVVVGFIAMGILNGEEVALGPVRLPDAELVGTGALIFPITGWIVAAWVCLPVLAAYALTVPREVRAAFGPLVQQRPPGYPPQYPPVAPPGHPPPSAPPPQPPPPPPGWTPSQ
jgi:hypothetical protein